MEKLNIGLLLGRFQPINNDHLALIKKVINKEDHLVIIIGSACQAKSVKNPWTSNEREVMIRDCLSESENNKVSFIFSRDYLYNNTLWLASVQTALNCVNVLKNNLFDECTIDLDDYNVTVYGKGTDKNIFPKWGFVEADTKTIDEYNVRDCFFRKNTLDLKSLCPEPVFLKLKYEIENNTEDYKRLYEEFRHIIDYKYQWMNAPFPPIFVTTDSVVIKSGHILVGRRRGKLGNGLLALPGGFLRDDELILDGCLRELKEETRLGLPKDEMKKRIREVHVFDNPNRSLRGRTITHAYCFDLGSGPLPKIKGDDDMDKAQWMPLSDVDKHEDEFFEDHWHIINFFCSRY